MKIQVHKCRWTGKIFEFSKRDKYIKHLAELRIKNRAAWQARRARENFSDWLTAEKLKIKNVSEIPQWILDNQVHLMHAFNGLRAPDNWNSHFYPTDTFQNLEFSSIRFDEIASNSHNCPHNGVTNWGRDAKLPHGYPGWVGNIKGSIKRDKKHNGSYLSSDFLKMIGLRTGGGGGGNEKWNYDITIFLDDWPGLSDTCAIIEAKEAARAYEFEQERIVRRLKGYRW